MPSKSFSGKGLRVRYHERFEEFAPTMRQLIIVLALAAVASADVNYGDNHRLKIKISGETRKGFLFIPKRAKKGSVLPLLVVIPAKEGQAALEIGRWQQQAYDKRFALFSVNVSTSSVKRPWHWKDKILMQRDMEAVVEGLKVAMEKAKSLEMMIDQSATVMTGHSGASYVTLWLGLRRPDLFLGLSARSAVFFKETLDFSELDTVPPNYTTPIFLYHGELDAPRCRKDTITARDTLKKAGYKSVDHRVIEGMKHEPREDVFLEWYYGLLARTAKGRKAAASVAIDLAKLKPDLEAGKPGALGKLQRLADREKKSGFNAGAIATVAEYEEKASRKMKEAEASMEAGDFADAIATFKAVEKGYKGLAVSKRARKYASNLRKSKEYKAYELLVKANELIGKDKRDKAIPILESIVKKFPNTKAATKAESLLQ